MSTFQHVATPFSYSSAVLAGDTAYLGLDRGFGDSFANQLRRGMPGVVSDEETAPLRRQVGIRKANASESLMKCRNTKSR